MKRIYWLMALAGLVVTPISAVAPYLVSGEQGLALPDTGLGFIIRSYLLALVFFAIITVILAGVRRQEGAHGTVRQFVYSLIAFSVGSWVASILFLLLVGAIWSGLRFTL